MNNKLLARSFLEFVTYSVSTFMVLVVLIATVRGYDFDHRMSHFEAFRALLTATTVGLLFAFRQIWLAERTDAQ